MRRLTHHVAELTSHHEISFALHSQSFDEEHVAANGSPGKTGSHANLILLQSFLGNDLRGPEKLVYVLQRHSDCAFVTFGDLARHFAADAADFALELAQARFLRVLLNDRGKRGPRDVQIFRCDPVFVHLFRNQVTNGNLTLLFLGVTGQTNHFHAIAKRRLNRVEYVCGGHEDHVRQIESHAEIVVAE